MSSSNYNVKLFHTYLDFLTQYMACTTPHSKLYYTNIQFKFILSLYTKSLIKIYIFMISYFCLYLVLSYIFLK